MINEGQMNQLHAAIKQQYPRHEPLHVVHATDKIAVVSAFNRAVGKQKIYHILKKDKNGWKHHSMHYSHWDAKVAASYMKEETLEEGKNLQIGHQVTWIDKPEGETQSWKHRKFGQITKLHPGGEFTVKGREGSQTIHNRHLEHVGDFWKRVRQKLEESLHQPMGRKDAKVPTKKYGSHARRFVVKPAVKILRRSRGLKNPSTLRNRHLMNMEREKHRNRMGGRKNAAPSLTLARWKNLNNRWFEKGKL
jgi:hypothetical protein